MFKKLAIAAIAAMAGMFLASSAMADNFWTASYNSGSVYADQSNSNLGLDHESTISNSAAGAVVSNENVEKVNVDVDGALVNISQSNSAGDVGLGGVAQGNNLGDVNVDMAGLTDCGCSFDKFGSLSWNDGTVRANQTNRHLGIDHESTISNSAFGAGTFNSSTNNLSASVGGL